MDNKDVVRSFFGAVNAHDAEALDPLVADDYTINGRVIGRDALKSFVKFLGGAFPDDETEILDLIAEGDRVVARLEARGTHAGPHPATGQPATNKRKATKGIYIFRVADGRLAEAWDVWDVFGELIQLGLYEGPLNR